MSGLDRKIAAMDAEAAEARAADWLQRQNFWNWSKTDQAALDAWLADSLAHRLAYWRLEAAWGRTERLAALRSSPSETAAPAPQKRSWSFPLRFAAAMITVVVVGAAGAKYLLASQMTTYQTAIGGHRIVALADGSRIELNTDTVLRAGAREAELVKGEAYFQIRHDAAHPFVVNAGAHRITDLGTKFLVRRDADRLEVALTEGAARIDTSDGHAQPSKLLAPGDVVVATANSLSMTKKPSGDLANALSWRQGLLVFKYTALGEAADEFNRYNRRKLVVADASLAKRTIYGTFQSGNIDTFARVARDVLGLHVESRGDEIVISR
ncbi:MAG TPA: FecR domain-containing protein [Rhizomicrobium sp.]